VKCGWMKYGVGVRRLSVLISLLGMRECFARILVLGCTIRVINSRVNARK